MRVRGDLRRLSWIGLVGISACPIAFGCSSSSNDSGAASERGTDAPADEGAGTGGTTSLPPEEELEAKFQVPVASGRMIWVANPDSNRIAAIDAVSLTSASVIVGKRPTELAALPGADGDNADNSVLVINEGSADATRVRRTATGQFEQTSAPIHPLANAWSVSELGDFAIAWSDAGKLLAQGEPPPDPTESYQDITVLRIDATPMTATRLSVGYRPSEIILRTSRQRAFAITEWGISVIALESAEAPHVLRELPLTDDPDATVGEVAVTADAKLAFVRVEGAAEIRVLELATGQYASLPLSGPATDLDLSADGKSAIVVVREPQVPGLDQGEGGAGTAGEGGAGGLAGGGAGGAAGAPGMAGSAGAGGDGATSGDPLPSEVHVVQIPEAFDAAIVRRVFPISGQRAGSVVSVPNSERLLVFSTVAENDRITLLDIETKAARTVSVKAPVRAVFPSSDGRQAVVLMRPPRGSNKLGAFALVPIAEPLPPRIHPTEAEPFAVALDPVASHSALIVSRDEGSGAYLAYRAVFPELSVDTVELPSYPIAAGSVPLAGLGFIAQRHPEGRLTLIDFDDGRARTLTGFELGSKVVDE